MVGSGGISKSVVQRPKAGSENVPGSEVQGPMEGSGGISESLVQRLKAGSDNVTESEVQGPMAGCEDISSPSPTAGPCISAPLQRTLGLSRGLQLQGVPPLQWLEQ